MVIQLMRFAVLALAGSGCVTALHVTTPATVVDGVLAPPFALPDQAGRTIGLADELAHSPVVLVFYRGFW
jgi:hypothetical protein